MPAASSINAWILDLYEDETCGVKMWVIGEDDTRRCLRQPFPSTFFAAGPSARLRALWRWLKEQSLPLAIGREERRDLFLPEPIPVLSMQAQNSVLQRKLFHQVEHEFPDLTYYDADVQVHIRHAARFDTFPLVYCHFELEPDESTIRELTPLNSRWDLDPDPAPLRVMRLELDVDPRHGQPRLLTVSYQTFRYHIRLEAGSSPVYWLKAALQKHDPDILITDFGDTWLLDYLLQTVEGDYSKLPLNRDPERAFTRIAEKSFFSYGQVIHRGQQIHLFGRAHLDKNNSMLWSDYALDGVLENARVTALPIQTAARVSPGTGISSMQMITALKTGVLIPWHKQQAEQPKTMLDLIHSDSGGMVYQPIPGIHYNVGEVDFVSMYPAIMVRCDISPEKQSITLSDPPSPDPGLVPLTLAPLLEKRVAIKRALPGLPAWDPRRAIYKERSSAHKWLLVVCFGYLGYRNARFGRIESHEAVTAGGREALLRAKEAAEDLGYRILHMFVDCLWVQQPGHTRPEDFQPLIDEVYRRTGLHIAMDGIYRWVVFLPSRVDGRVPVGTRYFGVFQDGTIKVRGIEARRRDTPPWIAATQMAVIEHLAQGKDAADLQVLLPGALDILCQAVAQLRAGRVPLADLLMAQKVTRALSKYTSPSPAARAAAQLEAHGKTVNPGQRVRFLYMRGGGVRAWDLPGPPDPRRIDTAMYQKLLIRAASSVLLSFGFDQAALKLWIEDRAEVLSIRWEAANWLFDYPLAGELKQLPQPLEAVSV